MLRLLPVVLTGLLLSGAGLHAQTATDASVIDVAVFYTPQARAARGGHDQIKARIDLLVAQTNTVYETSGADQRINLVAAEEVEGYTKVVQPSWSSLPGGVAPTVTDLERLRGSSDGYMDEIHAVRDRVWADIVVLFREQAGGQANILGSFGVSDVSKGTFVHELGHMMGLAHDRYVACPDGTCLNAGASRDAYGYTNQKAFEQGAPRSARWYTVMAYSTQCFASFSGCTQLLRFSNPNQIHPDPGGDPMGVALTADNAGVTGVDGPADAVRALNSTRTIVAERRQGRAVTVAFKGGPYSPAVEGGSASTVTVRLNAAPGRELVIPLTATGTSGAWAGDYGVTPLSVVFGAEETERTVTVTAVDDAAQEDAETLILAFDETLPAGVTAASPDSATVTLTDNDTVTVAPSIGTVTISSDPGVGGVYTVGEEIEVTVVFNKPVTVTGRPQLEVTVGTAPEQAVNQSGRSASEVLVFAYAVVAGDSDAGGVSIAADSLTLNGGTITDSTNRDAALGHSAVGDTGDPVDGITPELQTATVDAAVMTLTYDAALDEMSTPATSAFAVTVDGAAQSVLSVQVAESVVTLELDTRVVFEQVVRLSYTPGAQPVRGGNGEPGRLPLESVGHQPVLPIADGAVAVSVSDAFQDPEDDTLTYGAVSSAPSVATVGVSGSTVTVKPLTAGTTTITVTATDVDGSAMSAARTFVVTVPNRPPVTVGSLADRFVRVSEGVFTVEVSGAFSDPDNDALTYGAVSSAPSVASVEVSGSAVSVTPVSGGTATISVTATDVAGSNMSATQTFAVTVASNRSPEAVGSLSALDLGVEDGARPVDVSGAFRDLDDDPLTYGAVSSDPSVATVSVSASTVTVTPVARGTATTTVTARDAGGSNTTATQTFEVTVANQAPAVAEALPVLDLRVAEGPRSVEVTSAFSDPDGDGLTYGASSSDTSVATVSVSVAVSEAFEDPDDDPLTFEATSSDPLVATASATGSTVRVSAVWSGTAEVRVTAEDPGGLRAEQSFELTVPNRGPVAVGTLPALSLASGGPAESVDVSVAFEDPEDDPLTFAATSSAPTVAAVSVSGSTVMVTPLSGGSATVTVTATDVGASNTSATQVFGVGVDGPPPGTGGGPGGRPPTGRRRRWARWRIGR